MEATGERAGTSTEADITETTMVTGASADVTATKMTKPDPTDTVRIATDTGHNPGQGHHTGVQTIATAMSAGIDHVAKGIAAYLGHARLAGVATMTTVKSIANLTQVQNVQARRNRNLNHDHPIAPGKMITAGISDDARLLMSVVAVVQNLTGRHPKR
jgi:hypothetical protein